MIRHAVAQHAHRALIDMASSPLAPRPRLDQAVGDLGEVDIEAVPVEMRPRWKSSLKSAHAALAGPDESVADALASIADLALSLCVLVLHDIERDGMPRTQ